MCAACGSDRWEWQESSGKGRIFSWIITHQAMHPKFRDETPYAALVVEMEEGVRFVSRPLGIANEDLAIDLPVQVVFENLGEDFALPLFRERLLGYLAAVVFSAARQRGKFPARKSSRVVTFNTRSPLPSTSNNLPSTACMLKNTTEPWGPANSIWTSPPGFCT
jgi:hypothetical protein